MPRASSSIWVERSTSSSSSTSRTFNGAEAAAAGISGNGSGAGLGVAKAGNRSRTAVPRPGSLCSSTWPSCALTVLNTSDSPSPVPLPASLVVKKGSKAFASTSFDIPLPVSSTLTSTQPGSTLRVRRVRVPVSGMASTALTHRLMTTLPKA